MWEGISMSKHDFGYFFHEGLSNMFSHGFMSFAAIGITVACLLIMGTFTLVAVNADANLKQAEQDNEILAFVDDSYTEAQAKALQKKLEAVDNVASVTFISREEAMQSFISEHPDEEYFQDLDPNILRDRFAIKVKELKLQSQTVELIKAIPGIGGINAYAELTNGFITVRNIATVICLTLIAVLFVVSMFIISNTIKLTTFDRRDEIAIMKMVGATNGFIRWPFVYEGFMLGLTGAILAFLLQWGLYEAIAQGVANNDTLQLLSIVPFQLLLEPVNFLILDEPTNHLDMRSKDVLKEAIRDFDGTVIIVSHDRDFLDGLATKVYEFGGGLVKEHLGGIYDFLQKKQIENLNDLQKSPSLSSSPAVGKTVAGSNAGATASQTSAAKLSYGEQKELNKKLKKLERRVADCEAEIEQTESAISILEAKMATPEGASDMALYEQHQKLKAQLDNVMEEWDAASSELEEARK